LRPDRLSSSLGKLVGDDQQAAQKALDLIQKGEHSLALAQLTALTRQNPNNSAIRILASYTLLQLGNMVGAFREAKRAESASECQ
jgi:Flp pilus assembly protein TadD